MQSAKEILSNLQATPKLLALNAALVALVNAGLTRQNLIEQGYAISIVGPALPSSVPIKENGRYFMRNGKAIGPMFYNLPHNAFHTHDVSLGYWLGNGEHIGIDSGYMDCVSELPTHIDHPTGTDDPVALATRDQRWDGSFPRIMQATRQLLADIDPDHTRAGLAETPMRVAKAWQFWTSGYHKDPASILKVFEDGAEQCNEMVVRKRIPIYSHCEHHLAPIIGEAVIAYIPNGKIVGLSKLDRLADIFARRLQVQERMTNQIAEALQTHLQPAGCGVVIKARHMCMESRGVCHQSSDTITSALRGVFLEDARVRSEFFSLAHNGD